jgi:3'-phosphoadenosine 5'-phosphosulfate (PAPS) 3'-phosphatase
MKLETILIETFKAAMPVAVSRQQPIINAVQTGRTPGEAEGVYIKPDGSKVTSGDLECQKKIIQTIVNELESFDKSITVIAEETGLEEITGLVDEHSADFRLIVDPIDGTGNYAKGLHSNLMEKKMYGWGSMIAIQERNTSAQWETIAAAIYVSSAFDKAEKLHGKIYIATSDFKGINVFDFSDESINPLQTQQKTVKRYLTGGFIDNSAKTVLEQMANQSNTEKNELHCVAQSCIAMITGYADAYFQENPYIHDIVAPSYLAKAASLHVFVMPAFSRNQASAQKDAYPIFITKDNEVGEALIKTYCQHKRYDLDDLMIKRGNFVDVLFREETSNSSSSSIASQERLFEQVISQTDNKSKGKHSPKFFKVSGNVLPDAPQGNALQHG